MRSSPPAKTNVWHFKRQYDCRWRPFGGLLFAGCSVALENLRKNFPENLNHYVAQRISEQRRQNVNKRWRNRAACNCIPMPLDRSPDRNTSKTVRCVGVRWSRFWFLLSDSSSVSKLSNGGRACGGLGDEKRQTMALMVLFHTSPDHSGTKSRDCRGLTALLGVSTSGKGPTRTEELHQQCTNSKANKVAVKPRKGRGLSAYEEEYGVCSVQAMCDGYQWPFVQPPCRFSGTVIVLRTVYLLTVYLLKGAAKGYVSSTNSNSVCCRGECAWVPGYRGTRVQGHGKGQVPYLWPAVTANGGLAVHLLEEGTGGFWPEIPSCYGCDPTGPQN